MVTEIFIVINANAYLQLKLRVLLPGFGAMSQTN